MGLLCGCVKFIHPAKLDPMIERRRGKAPSIDARAAGPDDHVRMGDDLLVSVGWADRHELGSSSIHSHEIGIVEKGDRIAVLNG